MRLVILLIFCCSLVAVAEPHEDGKTEQGPQRALVPDFLKGKVQLPKIECNVKDELTRKMILTESEKAATRTFLAFGDLAEKYETVRNQLKEFRLEPNGHGAEGAKLFLETSGAPGFGAIGSFLTVFGAGSSFWAWQRDEKASSARGFRLGTTASVKVTGPTSSLKSLE